jgi:DnaK suppressor protein
LHDAIAFVARERVCNFAQTSAQLSAMVSLRMLRVSEFEHPEDRRMGTKNIKDTRRKLSREYEDLIRSINRGRLAVNDIKPENTEDEGDLAALSHDRDLLYNLHENDYARLRYIKEAIKAIDRGQYGECLRCGEQINDKRLLAVPWATLCIGCQEQAESEHAPSGAVLAGFEQEETGS